MFEPSEPTPSAGEWPALVGVSVLLLLVVAALVAGYQSEQAKGRRIEAVNASTFVELEAALGPPDVKYAEWKTECWRYEWYSGCREWCSRDGTHVKENEGFLLCNMQ